jgi:serine/threonine protein kinase SCH9
MTDHKSSSMRHDDEIHDHIGSNGSTPSGTATPQPELSDKRLPGIMHSYFAQVRADSTSSSHPDHPSALYTPALEVGVQAQESRNHREPEGPCDTSSLASRSSSIVLVERQNGKKEASSVTFELVEKPIEEASGPKDPVSSFTPPISKHPSLEGQAGDRGNTIVAFRHALTKLWSQSKPFSLNLRRNTSNPISVTTNSVYATHLSNPSCYPATTPTSPRASKFNSYEVSTSRSYQELLKLTGVLNGAVRLKNTPPLTPRALSNEGSDKKGPAPTSHVADLQGTGENSKARTSPRQAPTEGPPVGTPKGKLTVSITEARGLRPSYDPYVVCVFEWNEYISKGPKRELSEMKFDEKTEKRSKKDTLGGVPIRRTDSDMGKPMAIPMKSRQSSNNSQMDSVEPRGNQVTDPRWDHSAQL